MPRTLLAIAALLIMPVSAAAAKGTVHLRGTAYEFNNVAKRLGGATIRVAEYPKAKATVRANGAYDLAVPDRASVTPYIVAAGHHTIYLQTFRTDGEDLANVNFQTPSDDIYKALAALLSVQLDANGDPANCAIVSTFSTVKVRDLSFSGFIGYGAHGVAGATASATPTLPSPVYFNENVIPDRAQRESSKDGGVIWTEVPAGTYRISAHHPTRRFADFVATCKPGRIVNANPPWGLHELARLSPARVDARALKVTRLPAKSTVRVSCAGRGCPFGTRTRRPAGKSLDLKGLLGSAKPGQTLEVGVFAHGFDGKVVRWKLAANRAPRTTTLCVPLGNTRPRRSC